MRLGIEDVGMGVGINGGEVEERGKEGGREASTYDAAGKCE